MTRPEINWYEALETAEFYAGLTPNMTHWTDAGLRNLAHAYLDLLKDNGDLARTVAEVRETVQ